MPTSSRCEHRFPQAILRAPALLTATLLLWEAMFTSRRGRKGSACVFAMRASLPTGHPQGLGTPDSYPHAVGSDVDIAKVGEKAVPTVFVMRASVIRSAPPSCRFAGVTRYAPFPQVLVTPKTKTPRTLVRGCPSKDAVIRSDAPGQSLLPHSDDPHRLPGWSHRRRPWSVCPAHNPHPGCTDAPWHHRFLPGLFHHTAPSA